jgi:hypothetical protein
MTVKVNSGFAIVRGHAIYSTAIEPLTVTASNTTARVDRVVLKLDPATNSITLVVKPGTAGSSTPPALTQTDTGIYELSLATVAVGANVTSISAASVTGDRQFVGNTVGGWTTATRPSSPRTGRLGYNTTTATWEFWSGSAWTNITQAIDWTTLTNKPATFAPAAHTHLWADITDKPTTFTPATHSHTWDSVTGKPTTFTPATHSHTWSSITSKPTTFAPSSHSHSSYLESGDTISWANGSKRVHADSVSGSGTYYAVWVQGDGTFARNTSSIKFKENVRDFAIDPDDVLKLRPVIYDRKDRVDSEGTVREGRKDEVGLIAEETEKAGFGWLVNYLDGEVDGLRYDLLGVALLPLVQRQAQQLEDLEARLARLEATLS